MKTFCIAGPVDKKDHYFIPKRLELTDELYKLIEEKKYCILHAPRQTGKTTALIEEVNKINSEGKYIALYINAEGAQASRSDYVEGVRSILNIFKVNIKKQFGASSPAVNFIQNQVDTPSLPGTALYEFLNFWSQISNQPLVLFIDEIDSLVGDTLISVLRQLRSGYPFRPEGFPQAVCLVGVRDVRDYRIWSDQEQQMVLGGSAFNIKAESLILPDFTLEQVQDLYKQHTQETGQKFTDEAVEYAFHLTQGQPWLVNALAYQACFRDVSDRNIPITKEIIERSKEALIKRRDTHIDVLVDRLHEPRVKNIIEAILVGGAGEEQFPTDDLQYVRDLGLIKRNEIEISNPIYQEIIPRELMWTKEKTFLQKTEWYTRPDGSLDVPKLLDAFTQFFRENSAVWIEKFDYKEAGPHLLLMAFLQRIINGGGTIHREYALGRGRVDLLITWRNQRIVLELKLWRNQKTLPEGLIQTAEYMDINNATEGHLVIFDRDQKKSWDQKIYTRQEHVDNKVITVWGL